MRTKSDIYVFIVLENGEIKIQITHLVRMTRFWDILHRVRSESNDCNQKKTI